MRRDCINTSNPDYVAIVQALKDAGVITAEFEAKRDYLEYGTFRNPEEVVAKVLTKMPEVAALKTKSLSIDQEVLVKRKTTPEVYYRLRATNNLIMNIDKVRSLYKKLGNTDAFWNKVQQDFQIPKDQIDILKETKGTSIEEKIASFTADYSFTIDVKVSIGGNKDLTIQQTEFKGEKRWSIIDIYTSMPLKSFKTEEEANSYLIKELQKPTNYYGNLTVPGGTNYTENEIATPDITPVIQGHAQFATDKGIGWFRSDEKGDEKTKVKKEEIIKWVITDGELVSDVSFDSKEEAENYRISNNFPENAYIIDTYSPSDLKYREGSKTRRILEIQSDLFQKGRDKEDLILSKNVTLKKQYSPMFGGEVDVYSFYIDDVYYNSAIEPIYYPDENQTEDTVVYYADGQRISSTKFFEAMNSMPIEPHTVDILRWEDEARQNQFIQLLNKDNNWVTFFVKSIIQDSAKKGYEKVLFPSGNTASKVEGHQTLEDFKKQKEDRIEQLENENKGKYIVISAGNKRERFTSEQNAKEAVEFYNKDIDKNDPFAVKSYYEYKPLQKEILEANNNEINQLKEEIERIDKEGFGALRPIYNFYQTTVFNILKKQGYSPKLVTDEYGNTWNEVEINDNRDLSDIMFYRDRAAQDNSIEESLLDVALYTNPERSNNPDVGETSVKTAEVVDNANATANLTQLAEMLMVNLGVNYELVTAERAKQMLGDKYNGEPAFYYGDTVFFVGERLTMEMVFHEFSHPLVRAISKGNPQLFENLYNSLAANSPDIIDYVKTEYQELEEGTPAFMEEVIVTALGRMATLKSQNAPIEKGFAKVIKDILAAIKKMLRQLFGKVNVSTLDVDTSLDTLANMLVEGNRFALSQLTAETDTEAMFFKNTEQEVEELTRLVDRRTKNSTAQQAANIVYERTRRHIQELRFNKDYKEIAKLFRDQFGEAQYSIINKNLSKYQNLLEDKLQEIENDVEQAKNRADNVINTLIQIEIMAEKLDNYLNTDFDSVDNKDTLAKIMNYNKIIMSWENMITELKDIMRNAEYTVDGVKKRLSDKNATYDLVIRIGEKVGRIKERVNEIVTETTAETYEEILGPIQEAIDDKYKRLIDLAKSTNQPAWLIKSYEEEYAKITLKDSNGQIKDKIKKLLAGELNDANFLNSYLEGYMYNQDPIVFGLAKYIKDNYIDAINNAQRYYNEFATEMLPILEKLGFNPNNIRELGNILTFLDEDGFVDEKGVFQKRKVHTFLNANKNWRHDLAEWKNKLEEEKVKAKSRGDYSTYRKMEAEFEKWQRKYFYSPFAREIYDLNKLFQDSIGQEAKRLKDEALNTINSLSQKVDDPNDFVEMKTIEDAWDQYNQLFSLTYPDGTDKKGADLKIAERLIEYRTKSRQYYKYVDRPGAFQAAFSSFLEKLTYELNSGKITKEQFDVKKEQWLRANSVVKIKEEFYAEKNRILNAIKILTDKITITTDVDKEISDLYRRQANIIAGNRDDNRQLNLDSLRPEALEELAQIEDQIEKLKDQKLTSNGLTRAEAIDYNKLRAESTATLTDEELERLEEYEQKIQDFIDSGQAKNGLTNEEKLALEDLFKQLEDLETVKPSNYYLNQFAAQLKNIQDDPSQPFQLRTILYKIFTEDLGEPITDIDKLYEKGLLEAFEKAIITPRYESEGKQLSFIQLPGNEKLRAWFNKTHKVTKKFDKASRKYKERIERRKAYTYTEPKNNEYKESTVILDENGVEQTIYRIPSLKFKKRVENEAYANTERTVYKTIDNRGQWLPKNKEDMIAYRQAYPEEFDPSDPNEHLRYINEKYYELKEDPSRKNYFEALQKLTDFYLRYQEGLSLNAKLYLDVPRYRMGSLETFQLNGTRKTVKNIWESIKNIFTATKDGYLNGQNFQDEVVMSNMDMFDENDTRVPIDGKNYIDHEIVSLNIINSVMRYMLSGEKHKVKLKMLPFAKGIQEAVKDPNTNAPKKNKDMSRFYKSAFKNLGRMVFLNKKGENMRAKVIDNLFEREFEGVLQAGFTAEWQGLNKFSDFLFRRASMGFFALNVPSALKNNFGAQYQAFLEGVGGKYYNSKDLAKGNAWASKTMMQLSMNIYNRGPHSLELQKVEIFDPSQGRYESKMDERITRTLLKDVMNYQGVLLNTRKWLELQSALAVYGAMMYGQMVEITENGVKKMIPYMDAWVLDDKNQIKLKDGIDKEWGIGGKKYKIFINRMHDVQNKVAGGNSAFENPDAQRYLLYRFVAFLKRFITRILLARFQFRGNVWDPMPRYNVAATDTDMGWYLEGMRNIYRLIRTQGQYRHMMSTREKLLTFRMFVEMFTLYGMIALLPFLFGYDPDDEDRYRKLREKSGPLPFLFAPEDDRYEFNLKGWLENHALLMMIQVRSENELFNPILGRRELLNMAKLESIAIGATVQKWSDAITDLYRLATGDERAFYKRDVGPYIWQKEGSPKVLKDILSTYGFTGSTLSPEEYLKTITSIRNR